MSLSSSVAVYLHRAIGLKRESSWDLVLGSILGTMKKMLSHKHNPKVQYKPSGLRTTTSSTFFASHSYTIGFLANSPVSDLLLRGQQKHALLCVGRKSAHHKTTCYVERFHIFAIYVYTFANFKKTG
jgi:hypothetical protein